TRSVLHGVTAVAELKLLEPHLADGALGVLHGVTAVAELKRVDGGLGADVTVVLHGVTAVAELKPRLQGLRPRHRSQGSPRRHRRGRIEAEFPKSSLTPLSLFSTASPPWPN